MLSPSRAVTHVLLKLLKAPLRDLLRSEQRLSTSADRIAILRIDRETLFVGRAFVGRAFVGGALACCIFVVVVWNFDVLFFLCFNRLFKAAVLLLLVQGRPHVLALGVAAYVEEGLVER